jgi:hypothetical protein
LGAISKYEIFTNFSFLGVGKLILAGLSYLKNFSKTPVNGQLMASVVSTGDKHSSRVSPRIFKNIRNGPNGILGGLGDNDS